MVKLALYDPPMCCSTGVCGPAVDLKLPQVAADLDWLKRQGVEVARYNLAQQPQAFASNPTITAALREYGNDCLPLVLADGQVVLLGRYPERTELARLAGLEVENAVTPPVEAGCCSNPGVVTIGEPLSRVGKCC